MFIKFIWDANGNKIGFLVWDQNWGLTAIGKHVLRADADDYRADADNYWIVRVPSYLV